ncbi:MAG: M23 family metallopeptidase [Desulfovibrio sp.]
MLFSRYQITLFSHWGKPLLSVSLSGLVLLGLSLFALALAAGNGFLLVRWQYWLALQQTQQTLLEQRRDISHQILFQTAALNDLENRVVRIVDFNTKLRIMLNIADPGDQLACLSLNPRDHLGLQRVPALFQRNHFREMRMRLDNVDGEMVAEEIRQQLIGHAIAEQLETLGTIPVIMPTRGRFSSPFGWRNDPFNHGRRFHKGIDLTAPTGTPVRATANGVISRLDNSASYGLVITLTHSAELVTLYAHLSKVAVIEGQHVLRGQIIGFVGNTGRSKAPHLHYEVHQRGQPVNPKNYILQ